MRKYEYKFFVSFEDTNLVGNVYFANFIRWQGKCREFFIKEKAQSIITDIEQNHLALITLNCSCQFISELKAFDEVLIVMSLDKIQHHKISMAFDYFKIENDSKQIKVATGSHEIGCFSRGECGLSPIEIPKDLLDQLIEYR